jgi:hypothetical protein
MKASPPRSVSPMSRPDATRAGGCGGAYAACVSWCLSACCLLVSRCVCARVRRGGALYFEYCSARYCCGEAACACLLLVFGAFKNGTRGCYRVRGLCQELTRAVVACRKGTGTKDSHGGTCVGFVRSASPRAFVASCVEPSVPSCVSSVQPSMPCLCPTRVSPCSPLPWSAHGRARMWQCILPSELCHVTCHVECGWTMGAERITHTA